jgi:hypothetical protein
VNADLLDAIAQSAAPPLSAAPEPPRAAWHCCPTCGSFGVFGQRSLPTERYTFWCGAHRPARVDRQVSE